MCQEPTELLWIGSLTGLISILKFRFDTLIPNTCSQTHWPECNFTFDEWNNLLHLFNIQPFLLRLLRYKNPAWQDVPKRWSRGCRNRRIKKSCGKIKIYSYELVFTCSDVAAKEEAGYVDFPNLKQGMNKMWQRNWLLKKQLRWNLVHPVSQTAREIHKLKRQNGHTVYACLQP